MRGLSWRSLDSNSPKREKNMGNIQTLATLCNHWIQHRKITLIKSDIWSFVRTTKPKRSRSNYVKSLHTQESKSKFKVTKQAFAMPGMTSKRLTYTDYSSQLKELEYLSGKIVTANYTWKNTKVVGNMRLFWVGSVLDTLH